MKKRIMMPMLVLCLVTGMSLRIAYADDIPYNQGEVQKVSAFLQCQSMIPGKTNAELLGVDMNDPGTWAEWIDTVPDSHPPQKLPTKHILHMGWTGKSLAGSLDISGFQYMAVFLLDTYGGTAGNRSNFDSIYVGNNAAMTSFYMKYVSAGTVQITGNPSLTSVNINISDIRTLIVNQPNLTYLKSSTLGDSPLSLAQYPLLEGLDLTEIGNIRTLDLTGCPKLAGLYLSYMGGLQTIQMGSKLNLSSVSLFSTALPSLDLTNAPNIGIIDCERNGALTSINVGSGRPALTRVIVKGNPVLPSLELTNVPELEWVDCEGNASLQELKVDQGAKLKTIDCGGNALTSLDVSGLPALERLSAYENQLSQFNASGLSFRDLNLSKNKLKEVSADIAGHKVHLKAYGGGGYVGFSAYTGYFDDPTSLMLDYQGLPAPYSTSFDSIEGTGLPSGNGWKGSSLPAGNVDATFYFYADVHFRDYFERPEDNPFYEYGQGVNLDTNFIVGNPVGLLPTGFPPPAKAGYEFQGWYSDETLTHPWNLESDILEGELYLYPSWVPEGVPTVVSVKRQSPADENTSSNSVTYLVTFSEAVSGLDVSDFMLTATGTATGRISSVSAISGKSVSVTVSGITGSGTLRLDVKNAGTQIIDSEGNTLGGGYNTGEIYRVETVSLQDTILGLQVVSGLNPGGIGFGSVNARIDVNGNQQIDLTDVIHILQTISGLRQN